MRGSVLLLVVAGAAWAVPPGADAPKPGPAPKIDRHGDPLPDGAVGRLGTVRFRIGGGINALVISPDAKRVLVADSQRTVTVFDAATGRRQKEVAVAHGNGYSLAVAPNSTLLAAGDYDGM